MELLSNIPKTLSVISLKDIAFEFTKKHDKPMNNLTLSNNQLNI